MVSEAGHNVWKLEQQNTALRRKLEEQRKLIENYKAQEDLRLKAIAELRAVNMDLRQKLKAEGE